MTAPFVASLGMYDHPGQRAANDTLWAAIAEHLRRHGIAAPQPSIAVDRSKRSGATLRCCLRNAAAIRSLPIPNWRCA
ncbi:hypothetical protein P0F65_09530 [Sphingomonas sp. I4]